MSIISMENEGSKKRRSILNDLKVIYGKDMNNINGLLGILRYFFEMEKGDYIGVKDECFGSSIEWDVIDGRLAHKLDRKREKYEDIDSYEREYSKLIDDIDELNKTFSNNRKKGKELEGPPNENPQGFRDSERPVLKCPVECYYSGECRDIF